MTRESWPDGFMWGTGASSTQCEGAAPHSDWYGWERAGHAPLSGQGNGFGSRYRQDFEALASLGLTHHRLSLEWARLEPQAGQHDPDAVAHYRDVLAAAAGAGVTPWACLHHFTLPQWFADRGGFLVEENRTTYWARHVRFVAETFADLVGGWQPVNETNYYAALAYRNGGGPPGHDDREEWSVASEQIHLATAEAAVTLRETGAPVSSIFGVSCEVPLDGSESTRTRAASIRAVHWDPWVGLVRDGVLRVKGRPPVERPDLAGCFDLLGFSYYATTGVRDGAVVRYPQDAPRSPLGYSIWADGLGLVLDRLADLFPGHPVLVAEYGVGTDDDAFRAEYLAEGIAAVRRALRRGVDVRGFFHWTAVDNYEWLHGYDVSFGLLDRDRVVRPSARVLAAEALGV
ncbi:MAG TPA: family 1 glycosylhydrolase [Acidimicrobiales bacterium]|nr:family 1 glycosylhydrolase [Acidimicrobiales bacterium]